MHCRLMLIFGAALLVCTSSCARQRKSATAAAAQWVQAFYDWYVPADAAASANHEDNIYVWAHRRSAFSSQLASALQADADAQRASDEIDSVLGDFDPFTASQDNCGSYRVVSSQEKAGHFFVSIVGAGDCSFHNRPDVVAEVAKTRGGWQFVNFHYPATTASSPDDDLVALLYLNAVDRATERPHELLGFLLHQDQRAFNVALGRPFQEWKRPHGICARGYHISGSSQDYFVAFIACDKSRGLEIAGKAVALQLTGDEPVGASDFFGLQLGDPAMKVEGVLGKPSAITHEDDADVDLWNYAKGNYTVEMSATHKLYSIQVIDQDADSVPEVTASQAARVFAEAIQANDVNQVVQMSSGDIECSKSGNIDGLRTGPGRAILTDRDNPMTACLKRAAQAVLALGPDMKGADDAVRVWEKHSPGIVTKFPASSPLKEIVFDLEAGSFRVYEITFR